METLHQIMLKIREHRPCSYSQVRRWIKELGIQPAGTIRTCPTIYPVGTAQRILSQLGFAALEDKAIVSMNQLRSERAKARGAK